MKNFNYTDGGYQIKMETVPWFPTTVHTVCSGRYSLYYRYLFPPDRILHPQKIRYVFLFLKKNAEILCSLLLLAVVDRWEITKTSMNRLQPLSQR